MSGSANAREEARNRRSTGCAIFFTIGLFLFVTGTWIIFIPGTFQLFLGFLWTLFAADHPFGLLHSWPARVAALLTVFATVFSVATRIRSEEFSNDTARRFVRTVGIAVWFGAAAISGFGLAYHGSILFSRRITTHRHDDYSRSESKNHVKHFGLALHNYHDAIGRLPPGGIVSAQGEAHHGWATMLLPFIDEQMLAASIDYDVPWDHPNNSKAMQNVVPGFVNSRLRDFRQDSRGFGMIHYSANAHVLGVNSDTRFADVTDGLSNTMMVGEVVSELVPWGQPLNTRDPLLGLNRSPVGFGSPFRNSQHGRFTGGCHFLMGDGYTRWVNNDIDPLVLQALARPNDEHVPGEF